MKVSEAMLYIIRECGGEIEFTQWKRWEGQLLDAGLIENDFRVENGKLTCFVKLTDKGLALLERKGL